MDPQIPTISHQETRHGMVVFLGSATFFGLMAFIAKIVSARIPGSEVALIRFIVGVVPLLFFADIRRRSFQWGRFDLLIYRGVFGGTAVLFYFMAIQHIPVGVATLLNYTAPVFSGVYAAIFAGEPLRAKVVLPLFITLAGVTLVVDAHSSGHAFLGFGKWELIGLSSAVLSGAAVTAIRVARRTENSWAVFASFSLFGILATAPFAIWQWVWPTPREWFLLVLVGLTSILAQLLMTYAFRFVETLIAGVISQLAVIVSMILGALFLSEAITPRSLSGTALTIAGVIAVMLVGLRGPVEDP